ncbi:MAG TPA: FAD-dependent oxidoreductase, partial [Chthoniobacterales bacterium]|nr:FAD-dependent oxidoreductase [Chthoniobacterales bacterium]
MTAPAKGEGIYNVVVIGAGTAGLVTAAGTAGLGGRVALIERNKMGGDCLNFGCVPSKALISSARLIDKIRRAEAWGLSRMEAQFDFNEVFATMRERRARIAPNDSQERFESLGVDVFRGQAKFESPDSVRVDDQILRANNFVIATGTRTAVPQIDGIDSVPYFTNETIFDELTSKPESLIVLGGGPIGCELGQTFNRLGVRTTIVQRGPRLLPREDPEVAEFLEKNLTAEGISIVTNAEAKTVRSDGEITMSISRQDGSATEISAAALLICSGRRPNLEGLGLDAI